MSVPILRPYQRDAVEQLRALLRRGKKRLVLCAPTGSGKTVMASEMVRTAGERGSRVLFVAHRRELIDQTLDKLQSFGVEAGVIMGSDRRRDDYLPVQVASVQTLVRRLDRKPDAQLIIVDECHHSMSETYRRIIAAYDGVVVIGLTATPWRTDKVGLADFFEGSVLCCSPAELIQQGYLVDYDIFAYDAPDLHEVRTVAGEYNQRDLAVACNTKVLVGSVVREYLEHARGRRAILFPVNIEHSETLVGEFRAAGITAEHVDCNTPSEKRRSVMEQFRHGDLTVLASVGVLTEGFDAPAAEVCILARPTKSLALHIQMIGRVLRTSPDTGKVRALIHDHAGNTMRHGLPDEPRDYALNVTPQRVIASMTCPACYAVFNRTKQGRCPKCDELISTPEERSDSGGRMDKTVVEGKRISREQIEQIRGRRASLGLTRNLTDQQIAKAARATREEKAAEYLRLKVIAERKGFKDGFVGHQFRGQFSHWPRFTDDELAAAQPAAQPFLPLPKRGA